MAISHPSSPDSVAVAKRKRRVRVFLVDHDERYRSNLQAELDRRFHLAGQAGTADAAVEGIVRTKADVVLLDVHMPGAQWVVESIHKRHPNVRFLATSVSSASDEVIATLQAGACGHVTKAATPADLAAAIVRAHSGDAVFSARLAGLVLDALRTHRRQPADSTRRPLTTTELDVLRHVARGFTVGEIAAIGFESPTTVADHLSSVLSKLRTLDRLHDPPSTVARRPTTALIQEHEVNRSHIPSRRNAHVLFGVLMVAGGLTAAGCSLGDPIDTTGKVEFGTPLSVPPLAPSQMDGEGRRVFDLRAQTGERDFGQGGRTRTWGFNGDYLGPTLRAKRGERVRVNVSNAVDEPTTVHWHGMHLPARMDGGPHQAVRPGDTWSPTWTIDQPAATLWYHPHPHGETETHVYRGLAGMFIVDDDTASTTSLPHDYGVDDIPVIVQDRNFTSNGQFSWERGQSGTGILGNTILVNGTVGPYLDVTTQRVRLRVLNASNTRIYGFGLADDRSFELVGTDGGLLPTPYTAKRIRLSPAERAEIVVGVNPGERVVLRSFPPHLGLGFMGDRLNGSRDSFDVLELRAAEELALSPKLPTALASVEPIDPASATRTRTFRLNGQSINGKSMDMSRIDETIDRGTTEIWEITGQDGTPHNFHVHGVQFQVLSVGGHRPPPELRGWKDTVFIAGSQTTRIIVPFPTYTDTSTPYMFHCHLLLHEDRGMMGQFVVVEPGQQPGSIHHHAGHGSGHG